MIRYRNRPDITRLTEFMDVVLEDPVKNSTTSRVLVFLLHQVIATWCVITVAPVAIAMFATWAHLFGFTLTSHQSSWILTQTPYFPVQIAFALFLGWSLGGWLQHRAMLWVWVIPALIECVVVAAFPWIGQIALKQYAYLSSTNPLSHFFGWGCRPADHCLDQLVTTLPFYSASVYSLGAHVARRKMTALSKYRECMNGLRMPWVLIPGICSVLFDLILGWRGISPLASRWGWAAIARIMWGGLVELTLATYLFSVLISLMGRRFSFTRWFFEPKPVTVSSADLRL